MTIMKKVIIILALFMLAFSIVSSLYSSFAIDGSVVTSKYGGGTNFSSTKANGKTADVRSREILKVILSVVRIAAVGIGMVMLTVLGAKYMLASPNERAEIKQHLVVYVVGAFIMFGASAIVGIVEGFATSNIKSS